LCDTIPESNKAAEAKETIVPKYLFEVDYSAAGTKGLLKDGGSKRRAAVEQLIKGLGGKIESFYFTFGIRDCVVIADLPDNVSAAAMSLAVSATGAVAYKTTVLLTPAEIDRAAKKKAGYKRPGG
jgi:uncharacterized protein with GYD domain